MNIIIDPINLEKHIEHALSCGRTSNFEAMVEIAHRFPEYTFTRHDVLEDGTVRDTVYNAKMILDVAELCMDCRNDVGPLGPVCPHCGFVGEQRSVLDGGLRMDQCARCKGYSPR